MSVEHRAAGSGHLGIEVVSRQSAATPVWAASPLKILIAPAHGSSVSACVSSFGGGGEEVAWEMRRRLDFISDFLGDEPIL